jgi:pimeloyl-ACP methyl ester carboxylesterase
LIGVVGRRIAVRPEELPTMDDATRSAISVRGRRVAVYEWGAGPRVVLLVHGWQGRAAQFASLVRELRSEGYRVAAFDAPGSGESAGRTTDLGDLLEAQRLLQARYGAFAGVVGHSFGALAALAAVHEGLASRRVVGVASIPDAAAILAESGVRFGLDDRTVDLVTERFQARRFPDSAPLRDRFSGLKNPVTVPALFVHDRSDLAVPATASEALHAAHPGSRLVLTTGFGHSRVLTADATLDAVVDFLATPVPAREAAIVELDPVD